VRRIELQLGVAPSHYEPGDAGPSTRPAGEAPKAAEPDAADRRALEV
jgi:hypothetical protein